MRGARGRGWRWVPAFILGSPAILIPPNPLQVVAIQEAAQQLDEAPAS